MFAMSIERKSLESLETVRCPRYAFSKWQFWRAWSASHVFRSFKVGREVINRDALFCPKTSMYDNSQPHHCNTISVETTISRSLFCWSSLAFFILLTHCCPSFLYQHRVNIYLCFWCQTCGPWTQYFLRLFNQVFDSVAWLKDNTSLLYVKMKVTVGWLCLHAQFCCGRRSTCRRVPVGCSWDSCWL